jgi:hypothetical protein
MVAQSDWLPMIMPTSGAVSVMSQARLSGMGSGLKALAGWTPKRNAGTLLLGKVLEAKPYLSDR